MSNEREDRYAEAIDNLTFAHRPTDAEWLDEATAAVMAVADAEMLTLARMLSDAEEEVSRQYAECQAAEAEVDRLRACIEGQKRFMREGPFSVRSRLGRHANALWHEVQKQAARAEAAEAEVERLRSRRINLAGVVKAGPQTPFRIGS